MIFQTFLLSLLSSIIFYGTTQAMITPYYVLDYSQLSLITINPTGNSLVDNSILSPVVRYRFGSFKPYENLPSETIRLLSNGVRRNLHVAKLFTVDPESTVITINNQPIWWDASPPIVTIITRINPNPDKIVTFAANCDGQDHTVRINQWDIFTPQPTKRLFFHYKCRPITGNNYRQVLSSNVFYNGNKRIDSNFENCYNFFFQNLQMLPNSEYTNPIKYFNIPSNQKACTYRTFYTVQRKQTTTAPVQCPFDSCYITGSWPGDEP